MGVKSLGSVLKFLTVVFASIWVSSVAMAEGTGKNGVFTIHNETKSNTVVGFYTNDGSGWSKNWLSDQLAPGDSTKMQFTRPGGRCKQTLRVGWLGRSGNEVRDDPINIDICDASDVYLHDNKITYE